MFKDINLLRESVGEILSNQLSDRFNQIKNIQEAEFKVFSQFGDDGIIQYLVRKTEISKSEQSFVEFGTEKYTESNTRFLLMRNNWSGLVIDPSQEFIDFIRNDDISWRNDLQSVCSFVTTENINSLIESSGLSSKLGLLSIDIDGMDYWIWKAIEITKPVIVICEYNSVFGPKAKITVPYQSNFYRTKAHSSNLFWGCSLGALYQLGKEKGYSLVGSNSAGNNCYFVRNDRLNGLEKLTPETAYVQSKFRESRNASGGLTFIRGEDRIREISELKVFDVETSKVGKISEFI